MVPVPFHQQLMGSCMLRIYLKNTMQLRATKTWIFFLCWDRFEVARRPSRLFSFYSSLTTNVSGSLLSAEDIQVWYFLYDVWHLLLFCKHWQISLAQLICLVLVDVKPWKSEIYIKKYVPDERAHLLSSEK